MKNGDKNEINSEDRNTLESFYDYSNDLIETSLVKNGMRSSLNMKFEVGKDMKVKTLLPPWDKRSGGYPFS